MGDETKPDPAAAPPKRKFFKKAAWRTEVKAEGGKAPDLFSHSSEFGKIVAEKQRRREREELERQKKEEEERKKEEEKKRKKEAKKAQLKREKEEHSAPESKRRRRATSEREDSPGHRSFASTATMEGETKPSRSTVSPRPKDTSLSARYASMADSRTYTSPLKAGSNVIELSDGSDDTDDSLYASPTRRKKPTPVKPPPVQTIPDDDDYIEEAEDPKLEAMVAEINARAKKRQEELAKQNARHSDSPSFEFPTTPTKNLAGEKPPDAQVQLLVTSEMENTNPLIVKVRTSQTLARPRQAWCQRQGFDETLTQDVFLTWRDHRVYDSTTVARLGVSVDPMGFVTVQGDNTVYTEDDVPKIHLQAWTADLYSQYQREKAAEQKQYLKSVSAPTEFPEDVREEEGKGKEGGEKKIALVLRAKGLPDWKVKANTHTTFEHLARAYRKAMGVEEGRAVSLFFDGERLRPMDRVGDSEVEELDTVEVHLN